MLIFRYAILWLAFVILFFISLRVLSVPVMRRRAVNGHTVKSTFFLVMAGGLAALVLAFIMTAERTI